MVKDEHIIKAEVYTAIHDQMTLISGFGLVTTLQTCGTYGTKTTNVSSITGHQLLYVSGWTGMFLNGLGLHFDYGC